jgi:hypothetical protein
MKRYVIQYKHPRLGWIIVETNRLWCIKIHARRTLKKGWENGGKGWQRGAGFEFGFYDRVRKQFI